MFTGIVAAIGQIESIESLAAPDSTAAEQAQAGLRLMIHAGGLGLADVALGDSISIQGACMTAVEIEGDYFKVDVSRESLEKTVGLNRLAPVNLEKAVALSTRLGGHLVTGHIDGQGVVQRFEPVGESWLLVVRAPKDLGKFLAYKGSITVNGVSLTVNSTHDLPKGGECDFSINLIPHTIERTTLKDLKIGARVNLEVDLIARYVERMLSHSQTHSRT
jgi:riboflavin synthase